jgi:hypothetical protein
LTSVKSASFSKRQDCGESLIRTHRHRRSRAMNYSIASADRTTHLKVVVTALLWAIFASATVIALS